MERFTAGEMKGEKNNDWMLLEKISQHQIEDKDQAASTMNNVAIAWSNYCNTRDPVISAARKRCEHLRLAITKCEYFEQALCNCQLWCNNMNHILNLRILSDIHGLDIPLEYKVYN